MWCDACDNSSTLISRGILPDQFFFWSALKLGNPGKYLEVKLVKCKNNFKIYIKLWLRLHSVNCESVVVRNYVIVTNHG